MKLTLIRHGITEGNARNLYYGAVDIPLLPEGEEALHHMAAEHPYPTAGHYYTSPLHRTQQTLKILYGDVPFTIVENLREFNFGDFEMREYKGDLEFDETFHAWFDGDRKNNKCPNGESLRDFRIRVMEGIMPIVERGEDAVCVIHGGVIANIVGEWFPSKESRFLLTPHPGTGYQVIFEDGKPVSYHPIP